MIEFHYVHTPNCRKVSILLEELQMPYRRVYYDMRRGDHLAPSFRTLSINHKLPVIRDLNPPDGGEPIAVFESGAILIYLAEQSGRLIPTEPRARSRAIQWLMWQMAGFGPMLGQFAHFSRYSPEGQPYAFERYSREVGRLLNVLEARLAEAPYLAGDTYSIADIASWPLASGIIASGMDMTSRPATLAWAGQIGARDAVVRAGRTDEIPQRVIENPTELSAEEWSNIYGDNMISAPGLNSAGRDREAHRP